MNLLANVNAYAQEWVWRFSKSTGIAKYIFLAIARFIPRGKFETGPAPIEDLVEITGMSESTVRRSIHELEKNGELEVIRHGRRGTVHRYKLRRELQLPLDIDAPARPSSVRENGGAGRPQRSQRPVSVVAGTSEEPSPQRSDGPLSPVTETDDSGPRDLRHQSQGPVSSFAGTGVSLVRTSSQVVRTQEHDDHDDERAEGERFWAWWVGNYPLHNGGAQTSMPWSVAGPIIAELLRHRDAERLQAMAVVLWTIKTGWIAETDRSLRVLKKAADTLDQRVARSNQQPEARPCHYRHEPPCRSMTACIERETQIIAARDRDEALA